MPRPDPKAPRVGQESLFEQVGEARQGQVLRGRHSEAMDRALAAARNAELVDAVDEGLATVLRAGAWSLDVFEAQNKPYGPSKIVQQMTEALREAHMTPEARKTDTDAAIASLLEDLASMDTEADDDAPLPHTED